MNGNILKTDPHSPLRLSYGFIMDGVLPLRNITEMAINGHVISRRLRDENALIPGPKDRKIRSRRSISVIPKYLTVYPDPELDRFVGVKRFYFTKNEYLNLNVSLTLIHI